MKFDKEAADLKNYNLQTDHLGEFDRGMVLPSAKNSASGMIYKPIFGGVFHMPENDTALKNPNLVD